MSLKIVSLASGSKGNCALIYSDKTAILCDAGIPITRIKERLQAVGFRLEDISGVVVTHEHSDHTCAISRLTRIVPLYAHPLTAKAIYDKQGGLLNYKRVDFYENGFYIGDIEVIPFRISHDATYPLGYTFRKGNSRISIATDMGVASNNVFQNIKDSQIVLLEANYDEEMLRTGPYCAQLKARILSSRGHFSNVMAGDMAVRLADGCLETLILGHLSETNNMPGIALDTVKGKLGDKCDKIRVEVALQHEKSAIFEAYEK